MTTSLLPTRPNAAPTDRRALLLRAVSAPAVAAALNDLLVPGELQRFASSLARLSTPSLACGVVGPQGVGKSGLVNALIGREILPVDDPETTGIVVGIQRAASGQEHVEVRFQDGRAERGPATADYVRSFVHLDHNPGNRRGVATIMCHIQTALLREGEVLYDTPGTDSANPKIGRVTLDFLPRLAVPIFVLRHPCATAADQRLLQAVWRHTRDAIFVMNVWAGESERTTQARIKANRALLETIAREEQEPGEPERVMELVAVNVQDAAAGRDPARVSRSGLPALLAALQGRLGGKLGEAHLRGNGGLVARGLGLGVSAAEDRLRALADEGIDAGQRAEQRARTEREKLARLEADWRGNATKLDGKVGGMLVTFDGELRASMSQARTELEAHARTGTIDAGRMATVVEERLTAAARQPVRNLERAWRAVATDLVRRAGALDASVSPIGGVDTSGADFGQGLATFGGIVQGIGGTALAGLGAIAVFAAAEVILAGEGIAVAIAAGAAAVPVIGWIIAGGALLVGAGMYLAGAAAAESNMCEAISKAVLDAEAQIKAEVRKSTARAATSLLAELNANVAASIHQQRSILDAIAAEFTLAAGARARTARRLSDHQRVLRSTLEAVQALLGAN